MAVFDGFFDFDAQVLEATGKYDREYSAGDFTGYFGSFIGSGVCVYRNPDSMKVSLEGSTAWIAPGYLFIDGYWLANVLGPGDDPETFRGYSVILPPTGEYAVVAHLDQARSLVELTYMEKADSYPDCLVLAYADPGEGTVADTRPDMSVCGEIDALGDLSAKVQYAVNYIDNEIEDRLKEAQQQIEAQEAVLTAEIAKVTAQVEKLTPPPIGTVKFTASQNVGEEWLRCDGSFISEDDYPELVEALGKLLPSGDHFQLISEGEIGPAISNGVVYDGRLWVYSYSDRELCGVALSGGYGVERVTLTSEDTRFNGFVTPSTQFPLALSIVPSLSGGDPKIFLGQMLTIDGGLSRTQTAQWPSKMLLFEGEFLPWQGSISMGIPFQTATRTDITDENVSWKWSFNGSTCVPYVISSIESGEEWFFCATTGVKRNQDPEIIKWKLGEDEAQLVVGGNYNNSDPTWHNFQRIAFSEKNKNEAVSLMASYGSGMTLYGRIVSLPSGMFDMPASLMRMSYLDTTYAQSANALNVVGQSKMLFMPTVSNTFTASLTSNEGKLVPYNVELPDMARIFVDGAAYLWGKDIYMIFVGTGLLFSRTLEEGSFGYLDTTSLLGVITQWGYLGYSQDEGELYIMGQDTANHVKVAKMELNTLFDYASDGAWLPNMSSGGVPAYIKAKEAE